MRWTVLALLLASACAHSRTTYAVAYRPSLPSGCPVAFYGAGRPAPGDLVQLGAFPLQMSLTVEPGAVEAAVSPEACRAGATAVFVREVGSLRRLGGGVYVRELEIVLLAPPEPEMVEAAPAE